MSSKLGSAVWARPVAGAKGHTRNIAFERALTKSVEGDVRFDVFTRGLYATDASIYQILPLGVVFPKSAQDVVATLQIAREHGISIVARGAGTSQNGQTVGHGLVIDFSRHMNRILDFNAQERTSVVEPGVVLQSLNTRAKTDGLFFPVEPSTANRCTFGGMVGNNSSGARSLRFGMTADNVARVEALFDDGTPFAFGSKSDPSTVSGQRAAAVAAQLIAVAEAERDELDRRIPKVQRRVAGYNLEALVQSRPELARLLVGSEGTLAVSTAITIRLTPLPQHRALAICQFPSFR
ncbi:MAG: FAD-binding oxidoreductase, partial [Hyphomicrobiaceae bacterium]|nr:FAD-binding oxidoreductase [Hyphomicrobiaceae bacterium]